MKKHNWLITLTGLLAIILLLSGCTIQSQLPTPISTTPARPAVEAAATQPPPETPIPSPFPPTATALPATPTSSPTLAPTVSVPTATPEPTTEPAEEAQAVTSCKSTPPDALGPFYVPGAPERASVGQGYTLGGVVRSSAGCAPIPNAQIEFWLAGPDGNYADDYRATLFSDVSGAYTFASHFPPPYSGRPSHIHIRVTADGYQELVTQHYPQPGQSEGQFDLVLIPTSAGADNSIAPAAAQAGLPAPNLFTTAWEDRSPFRPGLIETEQDILTQLDGATVYHIDLNLAETLTYLQGRQELLYTNQEEQPLTELYLRLFPNLLDGSATLSSLTINGQKVEPIYELANSAARLPLSPSLQPGEKLVLQTDFTIQAPHGLGGNYGIFSFAEGILALAHFYPMVPVYDDEGWNVEIPSRMGDIIYADSSFYLVRVTAPAGQTLVTSGIEINREESDKQQVVTFAAGPVRDFYLVASDRYSPVSRAAGQTTINSYAPAEMNEGATAALDAAATAMESFNQQFGPYPFTEFDLVSTSTFALGVEYPTIVALLLDLYEPAGQVRNQSAPALLEGVIAHEVGHQWFYSLIGNDQVDEPWLDEALAQYATLLYYADVYGEESAAGFQRSLQRRWDRINGADIPIGLPVEAYSPEEYSGIVYGRGPLFIKALTETMGQTTFDAFIRDYYQTYRWQIATGDDFKQLAESHCACDLTPMFETWVYPRARGGN